MSKRKWIWWILFVGYCGFIVWMTLFNRSVSEREYELGLFWGLRMWLNGEPHGSRVLLQYFQNVVFYVPFGFFLSGIMNGKWKLVTVIALGTSTVIELTQYITALGLCEIDDVISNTLGAIIGCLLWRVVGTWRKGKR